MQAYVQFIGAKGTAMTKHKSGLHKDVTAIFAGVWDPETDNIQQSFDAPAASNVANFEPMPQAAGGSPRQHRSASLLQACKDVSGYVFRTRARRERKRLSSISKHLMINIPT